MHQLAFILSLVLFMATLLAVFGIRFLVQRRKEQRIRSRLQDFTRREEVGVDPAILRDTKMSAVPPLNRFLQRVALGRRIETLITQADVNISVGTVSLLILTLAAFGAFFFLYIFWRPLLALPAALSLASIPIIVLQRKKAVRQHSFERQLPDALDLITGALRSGMAFAGAVQLVAEESPDPVAKEFTIVFEEQRLGLELGESLARMTRRIDSREIRLFVTAVLLQRETGGNLAEILEGAADVIRDRFRILGDIRTITAQARLTGMVLAALPPAMAGIIWWMQPEYLKVLVRDPIGPFLIVAAVALQVIGYFVIRKVIAIKV
jgi:tight adherence protein B